MDFSKYKETKQKLAHYDTRIDTLNELLKEANQKRQEVCDNCSHDFVLIYNSEPKVVGHPEQGVLKHAGCLVCGQFFRLDENLLDEFTDKQVSKNAVLDITLETSEYAQRLFKGDKNVLLLKAEEIFNDYCKLNTICSSREMILQDIYYKVLELDEHHVKCYFRSAKKK